MPGGQAQYDTLRFNESQNPPDVPDFTAKELQFVHVTDVNGLDYSQGELRYNLNAITTSYRFLDWKNSFMKVPVAVEFNLETGLVWPTEAGYVERSRAVAAVKSSFLSMVDSMTVRCGNQQLVSRQPLSNVPITFELLSKWNKNDIGTAGNFIGFSGPVEKDPSVDVSGPGFALPAGDGAYARRAARTRYAGDGGGGGAGDGAEVFLGKVEAQQFHEPVVYQKLGTMVYEFMAIIPLAYVHDLFDSVPLVRGALWEVTLNTHLPYTYNVKFKKNGTNAAVFAGAAPPTITSRANFCPIQVDAAGILPHLPDTTNAEKTLSIHCKIGNSALKNTLMVCAMYDLEPGPGTLYLKDPVKTIVFRDFERFGPIGMRNVAPNGLVSTNVTPGKSKLRGMLIFGDPLTTDGAPWTSGANGLLGLGTSMQTPFSTIGETNAPYMRLKDFNVSVAGKRLFDQNIQYTHEQFLMNMLGAYNPSGNGVDGLRSGLITQEMWEKTHGFVYVDLTRHAETSDAMPMPIDVTWKNANAYTIDYHIYLFYEKEFKIDILSGRVMV